MQDLYAVAQHTVRPALSPTLDFQASSFFSAKQTMQIASLIASTAEAVKATDNQVLMNVYIPLVIIASMIIFYGSKRSMNMKEVQRCP